MSALQLDSNKFLMFIQLIKHLFLYWNDINIRAFNNLDSRGYGGKLLLQRSCAISIKVHIYFASICGREEQPVWKLRWRWHGKEVTWDMRGAETTEQGDCSAVRGSPQCCEKEPVIVDLLPRVSYNMQTANCCKGRVLTSMTQDPERYGASFEMGIGSASDDGSSPRIPENFILGIPRYTYGQPFPVPPSKFSVDKGRRKTKAVGKYTKL
ncbi:COBRA-like protein 6 [Capsicum annuum]|nr:COBRA-like protein 6 [Capsicum annuum]